MKHENSLNNLSQYLPVSAIDWLLKYDCTRRLVDYLRKTNHFGRTIIENIRLLYKKHKLSPFINTFTSELSELVLSYENSVNCHRTIWDNFFINTNRDEQLKRHRDFVEENSFGYGDRSFHYFWKLLLRQVPDRFQFLEIGVFKGQVISLVRLLSDRLDKEGLVVGVSPLSGSGDKYAAHPDIDYLEAIRQIHGHFNLSMEYTEIIKGYSNDGEVKKRVKRRGLFDIVYIDGCHDYEVVFDDIKTYGEVVKIGGFLVMDDSSNYLNMPPKVKDGGVIKYWPGLPEVSEAAKNLLEYNKDFIHLFACGHLRVWLRVQ